METRNDSVSTASQPEGSVKNHGWFGHIIETIQELDTEFPLSGGEGGHPHVIRHKPQPAVSAVVSEKEASQPANANPVVAWFGHLIEKIQDLECDFPLSGGEHIHTARH